MTDTPTDSDEEFEARLRVNRRIEAAIEAPAGADMDLLRETLDDLDQLDRDDSK